MNSSTKFSCIFRVRLQWLQYKPSAEPFLLRTAPRLSRLISCIFYSEFESKLVVKMCTRTHLLFCEKFVIIEFHQLSLRNSAQKTSRKKVKL